MLPPPPPKYLIKGSNDRYTENNSDEYYKFATVPFTKLNPLFSSTNTMRILYFNKTTGLPIISNKNFNIYIFYILSFNF